MYKPIPHPIVVQRLANYCRHQWVKTLPQLNPYQRQLAVYVLIEKHSFAPTQLIGLLAKSRSQIYADIQSVDFYKKTKRFATDAKNMQDFIINNGKTEFD